jgi:hypothetical protein
MTKKNFVALADSIKEHNRAVDTYNRAGLNGGASFNDSHLHTLAAFCASQNPRFNRERWLAYIAGECGPNGGSIKSLPSL